MRYAKYSVIIDGRTFNRGDILPETAADMATLENATKRSETPVATAAPKSTRGSAPKVAPAKEEPVVEVTTTADDATIVTDDTTTSTDSADAVVTGDVEVKTDDADVAVLDTQALAPAAPEATQTPAPRRGRNAR